MSRWFRMYDSVVDDPKVQRLPDAAFRMWVNLMCLASRNQGVITSDISELAFSLRLATPKCRDTLQILQSAGLIDRCEKGFEPHNWSQRQYKSDVSNDRVKRHRQRHKSVTGNGDVTLHVTAPETETETETEQKEDTSSLRSDVFAPPTPVAEIVQAELMELPACLDRRKKPPSAEIVPLVQPVSDARRAFDAYNATAQAAGWREAQRFDDRRAKALKARMGECGGLDGWQAAMEKACASSFLRGKNERGWRPPGLDWFLKPANFTKLMEGSYDNNGHSPVGSDARDEGFTRAAAAYDH